MEPLVEQVRQGEMQLLQAPEVKKYPASHKHWFPVKTQCNPVPVTQLRHSTPVPSFEQVRQGLIHCMQLV